MKSPIISTTANAISSGGTISGDVTISGDLTVTGDSSGAYSEIITDGLQITKDTDGEFVSLILVNESDAANTTGIVSQRFDLEDTGGTAVDSGKILVGKEASFTATASTQDSYMAFQTSLNGTLAERMRIASDGVVTLTAGTNYPQIIFKDSGGNTDGTIYGADGIIGFVHADWTLKVNTDSRVYPSTGPSATSTVFGKLAGDDLGAGGIHNVFIGENAGHESTVSDQNVAVGYNAMYNSFISTGEEANSSANVYVGNAAGGGDWTTAGSKGNVGIGAYSSDQNQNGALYNTAVGFGSLGELVSGDWNVAIGAESGKAISSGTNNVAIGSWDDSGTTILGALGSSAVGSYSIGIGTGALSTVNDTANDGSIAIGHLACAAQVVTAGAQFAGVSIGIGYKALTGLTTGTQNTVIGYQAAMELESNHANTVIGYNAMYRSGAITYHNTFVGNLAGSGDWSGACHSNTGIGSGVLTGAMTAAAINNVAVGRNALAIVTSGSENVAVGYNAGALITSGYGNVCVGKDAGDSLTTEIGSICIGSNAGQKIGVDSGTGGNGQVFIGYSAGQDIDTGEGNTAIGYEALELEDDGDHNTAVGWRALTAQEGTSGAVGNTALGYQAGLNILGGTENVAIGSNSLDAMAGDDDTDTVNNGFRNIAIGVDAMGAVNAGSHNTATTNDNIAIGNDALLGASFGSSNLALNQNIAIGNQAMDGTGSYQTLDNICIGKDSGGGSWAGTSNYNVAVGTYTLAGAMNGAQFNVAVGQSALRNVTTSSSNIGIGFGAGQTITTDANVIAIGHSAYNAMDTADDAEGSSGHGSGNIAIGYASMAQYTRVNVLRNTCVGFETMTTGTDDDAQDNVALGFQALKGLTTGDKNTSVGSKAGDSITTGTDNVAIGYQALTAADSGESNHVAIGSNALAAMDGAADGNVAIGSSAGAAITTAGQNTAIGYQALLAEDTNGENTAVGYRAGAVQDGGEQNTYIGTYAGQNASTGDQNVFVGTSAGNASASAGKMTLIGKSAGSSINGTGGNGTVAVGAFALLDMTGGNGTIGIGQYAGENVTTGQDSAYIGSYSGNKLGHADADNNVFLGAFSGAGGSNTHSNNTANNNVGIGFKALGATADHTVDATAFTASYNIAIGQSALNVITSGISNIAIGSNAGMRLTGGGDNIMIGTNSGEIADTATVSAQYNVYVGTATGRYLDDAQNNTAIGYQSMQGAGSSNSADTCVAVGGYSLTAISNGGKNTAVGYQSGNIVTTGSSNTLVGYQANVDAAGDSHQTKIGMNGVKKWKTARLNMTSADSADNSVVKPIANIPALSVITSISVKVVQLSDLNTYNVNVSLSTTIGHNTDDVIANAGSTITDPELLGAGHANTYYRDSGTAMGGTSVDIKLGDTGGAAGTVGYTYYNEPTTTIVGTSAVCAYICNAGTSNGTTSGSTSAIVDVVIEYY